jgi:hypothetical protein
LVSDLKFWFLITILLKCCKTSSLASVRNTLGHICQHCQSGRKKCASHEESYSEFRYMISDEASTGEGVAT